MAKLTKSVLKGIVKECLVEILSEGIGGEVLAEGVKSKPVKSSSPKAVKKTVKPNMTENKRFNAALDRTVSELTDDDVMRDIFADTARTTLQEQTRNDRVMAQPSPIANPNESEAGIDLSGIFDNPSDKWSTLAFAEKKNSLS